MRTHFLSSTMSIFTITKQTGRNVFENFCLSTWQWVCSNDFEYKLSNVITDSFKKGKMSFGRHKEKCVESFEVDFLLHMEIRKTAIFS